MRRHRRPDGAVGSGATNLTGGVFGTLTAPAGSPPLSFVQTVSFSAAVVNPILMVKFSDETTIMDFGALSLTLLDSNNAQLAGSVVSFVGSANGFNDGFAARINGTFGPGTDIVFTYFSSGSVTGFDSVGFTVGIAAVPEPASVALLAVGVAGLAARRLRRTAA